MKLKFNKNLVIHFIFWPVVSVSLLMNMWLFASFFSKPLYMMFGGIIGIAVDVFKLYALNQFDSGLNIWKIRRRLFPFRHLIYYIFFLIISAGASLLFGLIDIDRSIEKQNNFNGGNKISLEREIESLRKQYKDLTDFTRLDVMADRVINDTNRLLLSSGLLKIDEEKKQRRRESKILGERLSDKEKLLTSIRIESKGTFEVFDYLASLIPGADLRTAMVGFLILIIVAIELLTGECRAAMNFAGKGFRTPGIRPEKKKKKGPDTKVRIYKSK